MNLLAASILDFQEELLVTHGVPGSSLFVVAFNVKIHKEEVPLIDDLRLGWNSI